MMIRLGVIGLGNRACWVIRECLKKVAPELRVVGVVDPDEAGARSRLDEGEERSGAVFCRGVDDLVRRTKPDALLIGTRCHQHAPFAIQAAKYDLPLFLEKPVAISMAQAVALEKAFAKSRCRVVVSFPLRVSPLCVEARRLVEAGTIGAPEHVLAVNYVPYGTVYWEEGYRNFALTQGLFLQKATHDMDYLMYLMNSPIVRVAAMASYGRVFGGKKPAGLTCSKCREQANCLESPQNRRRNLSGGIPVDHLCDFSVDCGSPATGTNEDCSSALVEFASGAHGVYTQVFFTRRDAGNRGATVSGYLGTIQFDWYKNELRRVRHHEPFTDLVKPDTGQSHFGGDSELALDFIGLIRGRKHVRTPIETGLQSVFACLAAKEAAEKGRFVRVRQVGG